VTRVRMCVRALLHAGGPTLFHNLNFGLDLESRLAIVGPNGIGKSTLLNLISGQLEPTSGLVQRNNKVQFPGGVRGHGHACVAALSAQFLFACA